mmetsp:Transcript_25655/g.69638  ORF Transcript_25655/g.69638 Transcript_25655/m.69638 type:complete len:268 (-) Transcript_25655:963-1766(-)|eukprot:CAMPEP_0202343134 /NCGR_PEP_ID=MMETSP1126-20121109/3388_1 /ASSEMBLY_ACC=CAM_ASM_000457 /TAXON_ID=3047 /ORGANISM="Dunaliella tertiolecta, Strain CCMP1320" /LENGTH=267 /DNA_ID=CAMNT_0048934165 /DNA_START=47 /DNA_END=850 /DNA_ORIENTATION=+
MVILDGRMLEQQPSKAEEYPNGGGQQGGGRTIRAERKPAHVQPRKAGDGNTAPPPPSRIAGVSMAPLADAEACEDAACSPRNSIHPQLAHQGEHAHHPHHPPLVRGHPLPYKKPGGQLRVAVPPKLQSFHYKGVPPTADQQHQPQHQQQRQHQLLAEGRALHKQPSQWPEQQSVMIYQELNEADSLCGTPPSLSLEAIKRGARGNHPMGPLPPAPLSPSVLTICRRGSFEFGSDDRPTSACSSLQSKDWSCTLPDIQVCQTPEVPSA